LENFDHPFKDEVIHSLEALQKELSGLYSKRQFKTLNHAQLKRRGFGENYCVVIFTLEELNVIITRLGHDAAQEAIHSMGLYIDKHFGPIGGFSTRRRINEVVTVLPYSELADAQAILQDFISDFRGKGINDIWALARLHMPDDECVELSILAGIAQGEPIDEIDSVIESAISQQKEIGRLRCEERRRFNKSTMIARDRRGVKK
jgi:phospholipid/cholesterol/gamma-HCH transport system ATP-binding protein